MKSSKYIKYIILTPLALLRAFVLALKELVWTIAGIVLLNMLLLNYLTNDYPITISNNFLNITQILMRNIDWFLILFCGYFSYFEIKDILKEIKEKENDRRIFW